MIPKSLLLILCVALVGCQTIEQPKGSSAGYRSARFVAAKKNPFAANSTSLERSAEVNQMVQTAITSAFKANGIPVVQGDADLIIAYLLMRQGNVSTSLAQDYFGHGRDASAIMDEAHRRGVIESKRPDTFDDGGIVIDLLDARTNKLVFRNYARKAIIEGISPDERQQRINAAVNQALAPFFR